MSEGVGPTLDRLAAALVGLTGALAVGMGAWSAHGLDALYGAQAADRAALGAHYQMVHAAAAFGAFLMTGAGRRPAAARAALWLFLAGCALFPGALYGLALGGPSGLGAVAPFGGLSFLLGWLALGWAGAGGLRRDAGANLGARPGRSRGRPG
ncbi:MAG: DUF423 domain-containing protein [Alphaproteobacteria bacterium]|nr:DUF423 domain-containing protein [Alphaproteobacteria bacterium]